MGKLAVVANRIFGNKKREKNKKTEDESDTGEASKTLASEGFGPLEFPGDCEGNGSGTDLVFVHGLCGSRLKTWSSGNVFWPRDLLKGDVKRARVITWGYDASVANAFTYASKESIFGHADTLLNDLARLRSGITRPIVFICHSLGGLVVKEALIKSATLHSYERHPALGEIYAKTTGVIFLGTPHRGSSQETLGEVVANVAKLALRQPNKQLLQTLKRDSHILEQQRDQFTTISKNLSIVCIREELPTGAGVIVDEASASIDGYNVRRAAIHANHMNMVRFPSKGDEGYKRTLGHINDLCNIQGTEIQQENAKIESRKNEILDALKFLTIHDREIDIENAYAQTCPWILHQKTTNNKTSAKQSQFLPWLKNDETTFWISGKAGCGKSTLMKYVYQNSKTKKELSHWADGKKLVMAGYFFFDRGDNDQKSREGMLRSILHQILSTRRDLIPKVFSELFNSELPLPPRCTRWNNLSGALTSMLDYLQDSKLCLFLDGLDEYRMIDRINEYTEEEMDLIYDGNNEDEAWGRSTWITRGHIEIADFLLQFRNRSNVKVCISSRELTVFEQKFHNFPRLQVHEYTEESIRHYCEGRLTDEAPELLDRSDFVSSITGKSRGVFLWVRLVIDMLADGSNDGNSKEELLKTLDSLPSKLGGRGGLYMRMMENIKRQYLPESKRLFQLVMGLDDFYRPLDIITLFLAEPGHLEADSKQNLRAQNDKFLLKSWEESRPQWKVLHRRLKSRCGGLLEGNENVQFMHQTAKEFMSRKYLWNEIFRNSAGFVGESDLDLALLSGFVRRLKCCREAAIRSDTQQDLQVLKRLENGNPDPYVALHIPSRGCELLRSAVGCAGLLARSFIHSDHYVGLLDELDNAGDRLIRDWKEGLIMSSGRSHIADISWVELFLRPSEQKKPNSDNFTFKNFLELAILIDLLPYAEAKIRGKDIPRPQLQSLLLRATRFQELKWRVERQFQIIRGTPSAELSKMLLQEAVDPNCRNGESNSAMASEGDLTAWAGLLQDGLFSPFSGQRFFWEGWISTVKVFLEYGADPTVQWHRPHSTKDRHPKKIAMPDTVISAVLVEQPQYKKDLADIMELLSTAKAKQAPAE